ncbi:hypothetical protein PA25_37390 [Pseudoalteromonas sp. A25]|uniref:hypothetical protein n=1 Tax=Pseudoalteromonas sp. A25 TaxID=116092 RepID=UPI0012A2629E|nr:hypothetical protein [Pseudoalteromonas sp. A25]BBN83754.1 hypothetical protein PA25_37390 [Pseudoalteromonas sp. A25]
MIPISGIIDANVLLFEQLSYVELIGALLILTGLFIGVWGPKVRAWRAAQKLNSLIER